jgi:hypothetical protein
MTPPFDSLKVSLFGSNGIMFDLDHLPMNLPLEREQPRPLEPAPAHSRTRLSALLFRGSMREQGLSGRSLTRFNNRALGYRTTPTPGKFAAFAFSIFNFPNLPLSRRL